MALQYRKQHIVTPPLGVRILIVEDHATVRESLRFLFTVAGVKQILEANTTEEALLTLQKHRVDLVLLDVPKAAYDEMENLTTIKAVDSSLPVLVHSFNDSSRLLSRCYHLGAAGFVRKGQDKNLLIKAVRTVASGRLAWTPQRLRLVNQADAIYGSPRATRSHRHGLTGNKPLHPDNSSKLSSH